MSYQTAQWTQLGQKTGPFSQGLIDNTPNLYLPEGASPYLRNARLDGNITIIRPGHEEFVSLTTGNYPKGIGSYLRSNPADDTMVIRHNQDTNQKLVKLSDDGTITAITTGTDINSDNRMFFINVADRVYCMNGADPMGELEETTYSIPDVGIQNFTPKFGVVFNSSMWVAGLTSYTPAFLTGLSAASVILFQGVTDGSFRMTIDGNTITVTGLDFSGAADYTDIANIIQTGIRAQTGSLETVEFVTDHFVISSVNTTVNSSITGTTDPGVGTYIGQTYMSASTTQAIITPKVSNSQKVYKSVADDYEQFAGSGSDIFSFEETITGLSASNQGLFYFTKNTISVTGPSDIQETNGAVTYFTRKLQVKEGAINNACIVEVGTRIYYITPSNAINFLTPGGNINGFDVYDLSEREYSGITNLMSSLDKDQSDCFGYFLPGPMLIKWFFKSQGATYNDVCVVYDITKDKFLVDSNKPFYDGIFFKGYNYTLSMIDSKVYLDEYGYLDDGVKPEFEYWTKEFYISDPSFKKIFWETRLLIDLPITDILTQKIYIDGVLYESQEFDGFAPLSIDGGSTTATFTGIIDGGSTTATFGAILDGGEGGERIIMRTKGNMNVKGRKIQFRYTNTQGVGLKLKALAVKAEVLPELTNNLTF